jgi:hypothetical protein
MLSLPAMVTPTDRIRIFSHITQTRFLHIEDSLVNEKLRFFIGSFARGQGMNSNAYAFLDVAAARVVMSDLSWGKPIDFIDFKGGKDGAGNVISRVLKIHRKEDRVWIDLRNGVGQELTGGAIKPVGRPTAEISIPLTVFEARKLAHSCLAYLHSWDVLFLQQLYQVHKKSS